MDDKFNTASGWVLFAGIVALGASIGSSMYFKADSPEHPEQAGYFIDAPDEGVIEAAGPDLGTLLASADASAGEAAFARCSACHTMEQGGANGIGPNLYGSMGKAIGGVAAGYAYSSALSGHGGQWTWENMDDWLANPRGFAPGTKMSFAGLGNPQDRANIMEYMATYGGAPAKPAPAAPAAEEGAEAGGTVAGAPIDPVEAAGATGAAEPVPSDPGAGSD